MTKGVEQLDFLKTIQGELGELDGSSFEDELNALQPKDIEDDRKVEIWDETMVILKHQSTSENNFNDIPIFSTKRRERYKEDDPSTMDPSKMKYHKGDIIPLPAETHLWVDGEGRQRGVEVRGSTTYGCPTMREFEVLMAIIKLHYNKNRNNNINVTVKKYVEEDRLSLYEDTKSSAKGKGKDKDKDKDVVKSYDIPRMFKFSVNELCKTLGLASSGTNIKRLVEYLECLNDTTIYSLYQGGLYDIETGEPVAEGSAKASCRIIEKLYIYSYKKLKNSKQKRKKYDEATEMCYVILDEFFYKSMISGNFLIYNYDMFLNLKSDAAKRLYLILAKWQFKRKRRDFKYETLYERIPFDNSMPTRKKKYALKQAMQELIEAGFLEAAIFLDEGKSTRQKKESQYVRVIYSVGENDPLLERYNAVPEVKEALRGYGFEEEEIETHIHTDLSEEDLRYISALMRYMEDRGRTDYKGKAVRKIKEYVQTGLTRGYELDEKYFN